jgi:hypothetical protein
VKVGLFPLNRDTKQVKGLFLNSSQPKMQRKCRNPWMTVILLQLRETMDYVNMNHGRSTGRRTVIPTGS